MRFFTSLPCRRRAAPELAGHVVDHVLRRGELTCRRTEGRCARRPDMRSLWSRRDATSTTCSKSPPGVLHRLAWEFAKPSKINRWASDSWMRSRTARSWCRPYHLATCHNAWLRAPRRACLDGRRRVSGGICRMPSCCDGRLGSFRHPTPRKISLIQTRRWSIRSPGIIVDLPGFTHWVRPGLRAPAYAVEVLRVSPPAPSSIPRSTSIRWPGPSAHLLERSSVAAVGSARTPAGIPPIVVCRLRSAAAFGRPSRSGEGVAGVTDGAREK